MMRLLLEYARYEDSRKNYPTRSTRSILAFDFLVDLTHCLIQFSNHNVAMTNHSHLTDTVKHMVKDGYYHLSFCGYCIDSKCPVNMYLARSIFVCTFYLMKVSLYTPFILLLIQFLLTSFLAS